MNWQEREGSQYDQHEHLRIAAMTVWPWTFAATAYVMMGAPIAALLAPPVGALATGLVALHAATHQGPVATDLTT